jgi:ATP-binding cassette subfamily A (ABC1) protein 3
MVNGILREKEKRIKDGMRIMGLNNTAFYLSWVITYLCIFTVISICVSAILVTTFFFHSEFGYVLLFHWLTCLSIIAMGVCITTLCNRAKVGNIVAIIILFMFGWL